WTSFRSSHRNLKKRHYAMDSLTTRDSLTKAGFKVFTKSQSYFFLQSVKTIAVTSTAKGITSKQHLIGTIGDQSYVTHSLKVEGLRGIVTAPAKLESTTHVFAYEVDLFYTRLACSFKDLRLADRRFQLRTSLDYDCSPRCSYIHHLIPFREEGTKRKIEVTGTGSF
ncbi:unnamed protein product, partial [Brassica rapa]